ncbi:carboxymuconolactone decarboxylase family protein [Pseudodesulfovibrio sp.]|uniref:carboxymuconolactone decarboxylase family protein n=1 Tax=unclassified Pseudodesulfovibrio TaxID=2661612 RepID=UPI003B006F5E
MDNERYERGMEKLREVDAEQGDKVVAALVDIAPDLSRLMIEFPFGDVYTRPGLSLKERELVTISALAALGHCQPQLKVHLHGALNVGWTRAEIVETCIQLTVYAGFPAALNALFAAKEVFAERDKDGNADK